MKVKIKMKDGLNPSEMEKKMNRKSYRKSVSEKWKQKNIRNGTDRHETAKRLLENYINFAIIPDEKHTESSTYAYVTKVIESYQKHNGKKELLIEKKVVNEQLNFSGIIDAAVVTENEIEAIDYKTGFAPIAAVEYLGEVVKYNLQLMSYLYCLVEMYGMPDDSACTGRIIQPQIGRDESFRIPAKIIRKWGKSMSEIFDGGSSYENKNIERITDAEKVNILKNKNEYLKLCNAIEEEFLERLERGEHIKGIELTGSRTHRVFPDESEIMEILTMKGYKPEDVFKLRGIMELSERVSPEDWQILECYLVPSKQNKKVRIQSK